MSLSNLMEFEKEANIVHEINEHGENECEGKNDSANANTCCICNTSVNTVRIYARQGGHTDISDSYFVCPVHTPMFFSHRGGYVECQRCGQIWSQKAATSQGHDQVCPECNEKDFFVKIPDGEALAKKKGSEDNGRP